MPGFDEHADHSTDIFSESREHIDEPKLYRVMLHNDHYTTMDFVVEVLMKVFQKNAAEATKIMMDVHKAGRGMCGVYTLDIAASKTEQVKRMAKAKQFPLRCSYEQV